MSRDPRDLSGRGGGLQERIRGRAPVPDTPPARSGTVAPPAPARRVDPHAELKNEVHHAVIDKLGPELFKDDVPGDISARVVEAVSEEIERRRVPVGRDERERIVRETADDIIGYGPLETLLRDPAVTEIMVNGPDRIFVEQGGRIVAADTNFRDDAHLMRIIDKIVSQVGRRVDEASPMVDARLPDGSRVNVVIPPLALTGPTLTIRKFSKDPLMMDDLVGFGSLTAQAAAFLAACVKGELNILISGGTGSGKTTMLNALSAFIPPGDRIITIEDAAELQLQQDHFVALEARPANVEGRGEVRIRDLVRNSLRMRPDRIIVGEVRGPETLDMLQAMNTGHEGSLTTIHANTPRDALSRLETLVLTAGVDLPLRAIREQIASAFHLIVQVARLVDGSRRVTHITEVVGMEGDVVTLQDLFVARPVTDGEPGRGPVTPLTATGLQPHFLDKLARNGVTLPRAAFAEATTGRPSALRLQ